MKILKLSAVAIMAISLAACNAHTGGPKQTAGTVLGAIGGGLLGSQVGGGSGRLIATGVGVLLGAAIGNNIGQSLDRADQNYLGNASYRAFETGYPQRWNNPDSGNYGTVEPGQGYQSRGRYCREYQQTVYIGGRPEKAYGTACRQPDGSWQIV